jgi:DNA-binding CsgD family transcriptional regulator
LEHIDKSLLPLMWNGREDDCTAEAPDFAAFTVRLKANILPFAGVAFPVRLGAVGNGYIVFTADFIDLTSDIIIDLHGRSCQVMMDILSLDERRSVAAEALSEREIACLQLAGDGRISEEIAEKLGLSVHTVNAYLGSATIKLDSVNRIQAIAKAIRLGYIS